MVSFSHPGPGMGKLLRGASSGVAVSLGVHSTATSRATSPGVNMKAPSLTIGIEEEYQIIDPQTRELKSYITQILEDSKLILREQVKAELHQSMVEVGTEVCRTPAEARAELIR